MSGLGRAAKPQAKSATRSESLILSKNLPQRIQPQKERRERKDGALEKEHAEHAMGIPILCSLRYNRSPFLEKILTQRHPSPSPLPLRGEGGRRPGEGWFGCGFAALCSLATDGLVCGSDALGLCASSFERLPLPRESNERISHRNRNRVVAGRFDARAVLLFGDSHAPRAWRLANVHRRA